MMYYNFQYISLEYFLLNLFSSIALDRVQFYGRQKCLSIKSAFQQKQDIYI